MPISNRLTVIQAGPGAPLNITALVNASAAELLAWQDNCLGVTTGTTPPATFAGFAHSNGANADYVFWDSVKTVLNSLSAPGTTSQSNVEQLTFQVALRLDSNYVAGRTLWFATFLVTPPVSGSVPQSVSNGVLIQ